jgi:1,4-dihydroxy-2-naphthoate octaprenyltransferase
MDVSLLVRATRAHFLPASLIPFCIGAAFAFSSGFAINAFRFFAGITGVAAAHLAGNVLNDYFDDRSKADTITLRKSPFFGGSRVIQDGLLGPSGMLRLALAFLAVSFICGAALFFSVRSLFFLFYVIAAGVLIVEYTAPPLRLAYNRWGEADIFLCFGIALTPGAFYRYP